MDTMFTEEGARIYCLDQIKKRDPGGMSPEERIGRAMADARLTISLSGIDALCESPIEKQTAYALLCGFYTGSPTYCNVPSPEMLKFLDGEPVNFPEEFAGNPEKERLYIDCMTTQEFDSDYWLMPNTWITKKIRADFVITNAPSILRKQFLGKKVKFSDVRSVVIECDSFEYHGEKDKFLKDKKRSREISSVGLPVLHFSGSEIVRSPAEVAVEIMEYVLEHIGKVKKLKKEKTSR